MAQRLRFSVAGPSCGSISGAAVTSPPHRLAAMVGGGGGLVRDDEGDRVRCVLCIPAQRQKRAVEVCVPAVYHYYCCEKTTPFGGGENRNGHRGASPSS